MPSDQRIEPVPASPQEKGAPEYLSAVQVEFGGGAGLALFRMLARAGGAAEAFWRFLRGTLYGGSVARTTKELVALAATKAARVDPLAQLFRETLAARGLDEGILDDIVSQGESPRLAEKARKCVSFARRAALQPAVLREDDFAQLRRAGITEEEIAELVLLGALLASLIACARALGLAGEEGE